MVQYRRRSAFLVDLPDDGRRQLVHAFHGFQSLTSRPSSTLKPPVTMRSSVHYGLHQRLEQSRECTEALLPLTRALVAEPNPVVPKAVLHAAGRTPTADIRAPLLNRSLQMARLAQQAHIDRRVPQSA